jgi:hypothetical protein
MLQFKSVNFNRIAAEILIADELGARNGEGLREQARQFNSRARAIKSKADGG